MTDPAYFDHLRLFQQAPGFVCFLTGPTHIIQAANAAYFQLVGQRELLGRPVHEALPEVATQGFVALLDQVYETGEPYVGRTVPIDLQRSPGAPLTHAWVDFVYQPIRDAAGDVLGILAQGHDVTEVKRQEMQREVAEAALRRSEERYRTLFESIDDGYCLMQMIIDVHGKTLDYRFLEANAAFEAQTGLRNALGKTARELVPDLDPSWFELYGKVAETGKSARFENHAPAMDGRWFDVYASQVGDPKQRYVALVFKDITERKRSEREREQLLAAESAARRHAEEASRLKDEFLATLSHELRTPLHSMMGWISLLRMGRLTEDKRARGLETIERNTKAQAKLIDDLLDISAIMAGKLRLDVQATELKPIIEAAVETVRPAADAKSIRLQLALSSDCVVRGDASRLQQVAWNILSNAVKFTPKHGRVQVLLECHDSAAELSVIDSGRGIADEFLPYVFDRFRQQDGGVSRQKGGLGLGLAIVRQLVEMHGGTVSVSSDGEGCGATFSVKIPISAVKAQDANVPSTFAEGLEDDGVVCPPGLEGLRVLVVDDERDAREMLGEILESCGASVRLAESAAECMRMLAAEPPDVLVSDIGMPQEDGYALIRDVRRLSKNAGGSVPAVALTAYARPEDRMRALLSGFTSHVPKPVDPLELLAVVASLCQPLRRVGRD